MRPIVHRLTLILGFVAVAALSGCAGRPPASTIGPGTGGALPPASHRHFDRRGESVSLRLIPYSELGCGATLKIGSKTIRFLPQDQAVSRVKSSAAHSRIFAATATADVVSSIVGFAIDAVQAELEKEAARHIQQYRDRLYADDFWTAPNTPRYAGFELVRTTQAYPEATPASRFVFAFEPSSSDSRMFMIRPVYLRVASAAAKVSPSGGTERRLTIDANIVMQAAYFTSKGAFVQESVADATFTHPGYALSSATPLIAWYDAKCMKWEGALASRYAGYFMAPPPKDASSPGGAFQLFVAMTETDDSRARTNLLRFAEFVGAQKETVVQSVTTAATNAN